MRRRPRQRGGREAASRPASDFGGYVTRSHAYRDYGPRAYGTTVPTQVSLQPLTEVLPARNLRDMPLTMTCSHGKHVATLCGTHQTFSPSS